MSFKFLHDKSFYEDIYDKTTIEHCRSGETMVNKVFSEMEKKVSCSEIKKHHAGWYFQYSAIYFQSVELIAAGRFTERQKIIDGWIERDRKQEERLESAEIIKMPYCRYCGKNMALISKDYMSRGKNIINNKSEDDILFMFECRYCNKRAAYWQDSIEWEKPKTYCEKCNGIMNEKESEDKPKVFTTTYTCQDCGYKNINTIDLNKSRNDVKPADPLYELDYKRFIFDEGMVNKCLEKVKQFDRILNLYIKPVDQTENVHAQDQAKKIKRLKIAELISVLCPVIVKADYSDFKIGEPQMGHEVIINFNCLDAKSDREENDSKKELQKIIQRILKDTNWRLMSDEISYRLGYLSGRLRAYEKEEDIMKLIDVKLRDGTKQNDHQSQQFEFKEPELKGFALRDAVQAYMQNLTLRVDAIEDGTKRPDKILTLVSEFHPNLRVLIPTRKGDDSVPKFVRDFNFKMISKSTVPGNRSNKKQGNIKKSEQKEN